MKHIRLIGFVFTAVLILGGISVTSASATSPELRQKGGAEIPEKTEVTAKTQGPEAVIAVGLTTVTCTSAESTKGEIVGKTGKIFSIILLFKNCLDTEKTECSSEGQPKGSIVTQALLVTLFNTGTEHLAYVESEASKGMHNGVLAKFSCGSGNPFMLTGCQSEKLKLTEESTMIEDVLVAGTTEAEEPNGTKFKCEMVSLTLKAAVKATKALSVNVKGKLLALELT